MRKAALAIMLLLAVSGLARAAAAPASAPAEAQLTPQEAQRALQILQNPQRRNELIETLRVIAKAAPAPPAKAAASAAAAPIVLAPNSLAGQLLTQVSQAFTVAMHDIFYAVTAVTHFRSLSRSLVQFAADPVNLATMADTAWRLILVFGAALLAERLAQLAFRRAVGALEGAAAERAVEAGDEAPPPGGNDSEHAAPAPPGLHFLRARRLLRRLPLILLRLLLELIPVCFFAIVALLLLGTPIGASYVIREAIFKLLSAYFECRVLMCVLRMLVSPQSPPLRLLRVSDQTAAYIETSGRRIAAVAVFGIALTQVAEILGLSAAGHDALARLVGLLTLLLLSGMVVQCRRGVARRIRAPQGSTGAVAGLRNWLGDIWHYLAIFLIVVLWVVWAVEVGRGVTRLLLACAETLALLVGARLVSIVVLGLFDRLFHGESGFAKRFVEVEGRAQRYLPLLRIAISIIIGAAAILALLEIWGAPALSWFNSGRLGARLLSAAVTIAIAVVVAVVVWELANAALERHLARLNNEAQLLRSSRLRTLLPMLRTTLLLVILAIVGLTALSELGVNIAPLLAGAGIVGIAVGFGSQKLVQDVITGLFLLLENAVQVGDVVTVAGLTGSIENLSIRTLWLRASDGSVYVVPFSSVSTVTNSSRGIGNAAVNVSISFDEDIDRASQELKAIATAMRQETPFNAMMLSDLELFGVDKVDAATVTILGQIVCTVSGRWRVQREFNRRMKNRFQEAGIKLARPIQTVVLEDEAEGAAQALGSARAGGRQAQRGSAAE